MFGVFVVEPYQDFEDSLGEKCFEWVDMLEIDPAHPRQRDKSRRLGPIQKKSPKKHHHSKQRHFHGAGKRIHRTHPFLQKRQKKSGRESPTHSKDHGYREYRESKL